MNKLKNQQLFLNLSGKWSHRAKCGTKNLRQTSKYKYHNLQSRNPQTDTSTRSSVGVEKPVLEFTSFWRISVNKYEREKFHSWGALHFCELYLQELLQDLTENNREKKCFVVPAEGGKSKPFWNMPLHPVTRNKARLQDKLFY